MRLKVINHKREKDKVKDFRNRILLKINHTRKLNLDYLGPLNQVERRNHKNILMMTSDNAWTLGTKRATKPKTRLSPQPKGTRLLKA